MATTKWAYHKEWSFASNCLFFWKICFSFRISWKELIWYINDPDVHICIFCNCRSLILGCFFPLSILNLDYLIQGTRSSPSEVFLGKGVLKICSKFTEEHPCRSVTSRKLLCNFIEIALWHGFSPVNLLHMFRTPFYKNTSGRLLLTLIILHPLL